MGQLTVHCPPHAPHPLLMNCMGLLICLEKKKVTLSSKQLSGPTQGELADTLHSAVPLALL